MLINWLLVLNSLSIGVLICLNLLYRSGANGEIRTSLREWVDRVKVLYVRARAP